MEFEAALHGVDLKKKTEEEWEDKPTTGSFKFGDPDSYKDMPEEERKKLTRQMMGKHKKWYHGTAPLGEG